MPVVNGIVTVPVTEPRQLQDIFGIVTNNYGDIFTKTKINMWSKYKPICLNVTGKLTEEDLYGASYGLEDNTEYHITDNNEIIEAFNNAVNGIYSWSYRQPRGADYGEWFRGWDWVGYNHSCVCPFYFEDNSYYDNAYIGVGMHKSLPTNNITARDLGQILSNDFSGGNVSYGILFTKNGGSVQFVGEDESASSPVGLYPVYDADGNTMSYSIRLGGAGTYVCVPVLAMYNRGMFAVLPFTPITMVVEELTYQALVINASFTAGNKYTINNLYLRAGEQGCYAGTVYVYFLKELPGVGDDPDTDMMFSYSYAATSTPYATVNVVSDETLDINPQEFPYVMVRTKDEKASTIMGSAVYVTEIYDFS